MIERIRYRFLMRRLRGEIARTVCGSAARDPRKKEMPQTAVPHACNACGSIV
jgi:hypothetical protein